MATVLMPLPDTDFDVTEVAVPWRLLTQRGHNVVFATEAGRATPAADPLLLTGVIFGQLGAEPEPKAFYEALTESPEFGSPVSWAEVKPSDFDGLILPGGHAQGMKQYLGSEVLQAQIAAFWALERPVGAICHGVLPLARSKGADGKSVLHGKRTTCLPAYMERIAYWLTAWKHGRYYRTYDQYVQQEVKAALALPAHFERGPITLIKRGTATDHGGTFVVEDGHYVSARWPGDAYAFAERFIERLG